MAVCRAHGTEVSSAKMNILLHFLVEGSLAVRLMEADTALLPAEPIQSLGLQLLGFGWWCCWVICAVLREHFGRSLFPRPVRHHTLPSWLEIRGVVNSLLGKWVPLGSVCGAVWGSRKTFPALWGACPGATTSSLECWQLNLESASWAQSWSSNNVDVCVLPGMPTVFSDTADRRWMEWK